MYGLVNKAVQGLVLQSFGEAKWESILEKAGLEIDFFVSMQTYDDAITYKLVEVCSNELDMSQEEVLIAFGKY